MKSTQCKMILRHLETHGSITRLEALRLYSCARLASRIYDLKQSGHMISKELVIDVNKDGDPIRYARYSLIKQ